MKNLHEPNLVADRVKNAIALYVGGGVALTVAKKIWCNHPITCGSEPTNLVPPHVPNIRKAMQQEDQWSFPFLDVMYLDAVDL